MQLGGILFHVSGDGIRHHQMKKGVYFPAVRKLEYMEFLASLCGGDENRAGPDKRLVQDRCP